MFESEQDIFIDSSIAASYFAEEVATPQEVNGVAEFEVSLDESVSIAQDQENGGINALRAARSRRAVGEAIRLHGEGYSREEIAEAVERSPGWVGKQFAKIGIKPEGRTAKASEQRSKSNELKKTEAVHLYREGLSCEDIAAKVERSPDWVRRHLENVGTLDRPAPKLREDIIESDRLRREAVRLHGEGYSREEIAEKVERSPRWVRNSLVAAGVPKKEVSRKNFLMELRKVERKARAAEALRLHRLGKNCLEIAETISVAPLAVRRYLRSEGINITPPDRLPAVRAVAMSRERAEYVEEVLNMYAQGKDYLEIAYEVGRRPRRVSSVLVKSGIPREQVFLKGEIRQLRQEFAKLRRTGREVREIAIATGNTEKRVSSYLYQEGLADINGKQKRQLRERRKARAKALHEEGSSLSDIAGIIGVAPEEIKKYIREDCVLDSCTLANNSSERLDKLSLMVSTLKRPFDEAWNDIYANGESYEPLVGKAYINGASTRTIGDELGVGGYLVDRYIEAQTRVFIDRDYNRGVEAQRLVRKIRADARQGILISTTQDEDAVLIEAHQKSMRAVSWLKEFITRGAICEAIGIEKLEASKMTQERLQLEIEAAILSAKRGIVISQAAKMGLKNFTSSQDDYHEANLHMLEALRKFDPTKTDSLQGYLAGRMKYHFMNRLYASDHLREFGVSVNVRADFGKYKVKMDNFIDMYGRYPDSTDELINAMGGELGRAERYWERLMTRPALSLDAEDNETGRAFVDSVGRLDGNADGDSETAADAIVAQLLGYIPEHERETLVLTISGEPTKELAKKLGASVQELRYRQRKIITRLRKIAVEHADELPETYQRLAESIAEAA